MSKKVILKYRTDEPDERVLKDAAVEFEYKNIALMREIDENLSRQHSGRRFKPVNPQRAQEYADSMRREMHFRESFCAGWPRSLKS